MVARGAEIIVIVPLAVGPPSDEGLVSRQGDPLDGAWRGGRDFFFFLLTSLLSRNGYFFAFSLSRLLDTV